MAVTGTANLAVKVQLTLFTRAIYEDAVVSGPSGTRRIAFVDAPGGVRLEFMEQLEPR